MKLQGIGIIGLIASGLIYAGCSGSKTTDGGTSSTTNSAFSGKLTSLSVSNFELGAMAAKTITHVMAVNPSSNPERHVATVGADGSFSLGVNAGKPYVFVFIAQDGSLKGPAMIAGLVKVAANNLDTLPISTAGNVALGDVSVGTTGVATPSTTVSALLAALGVSSSEASFIGAVDDLALRSANPDVDGNGVIDALENKDFRMDWHIRANTQLSGSPMELDDVENAYANPANVSLSWILGSGYAVYAQSFDNVNYVVNSGQSTALQNGGTFAASVTAVTPTSMSGGTFSDMRQWGPDYNMTTQELGGSDAAATFTYSLGSKQLTYSNVKTKTKAQLNADGLILPFIKVNTSAGKITSVDYKWMKRSGSNWVDATVAEVGLLVQSSGAMLTLYTEKTMSSVKSLSFKFLPTAQSGNVAVNGTNFTNTSVADPANVALSSVCSAALSYDDNIGLRIFAGAPSAIGGSTCN